MNKDNLLRQHKEILELAEKITSFKTPQNIVEHAFPISLLLGQLAGKIKIHLSTEDKFVYPQLMHHATATVRQTSSNFATEMGHLAATFETYKSRYIAARTISEQPEAFLKESQQIFHALSQRIEKENLRLYTLLEN